MKKSILLLALLLSLTGCSNYVQQSDKISIVCTVFPTVDWINNILAEKKDKFDILLLGADTDIHSYQPSAEDIAKIKTCDLLVYVGGETDKWVEDVVRDGKTRKIKLFDVICDELEEEQSEEHQHEKDENLYDEHIWLSLDIAEELIEALSKEICFLDAENTAVYLKNAEKYENSLNLLDNEYERAVNESKNKSVIFADRFPFLYMMKDYGIKYYAAFPGCSSDTDASFKTVANLAGKMRELKKETLLVLENSQQNIAETVMKSAGINGRTATMKSCQFVTKEDIEKGASYIQIMKENLISLEQALK